jgi:hypothetical protein
MACQAACCYSCSHGHRRISGNDLSQLPDRQAGNCAELLPKVQHPAHQQEARGTDLHRGVYCATPGSTFERLSFSKLSAISDVVHRSDAVLAAVGNQLDADDAHHHRGGHLPDIRQAWPRIW